MVVKILLFQCFVTLTACWSTEDIELFDLVESTPKNFYSILGVNEKASANEIKKAYRKLSTQLHPDRNKNKNAEEEFRQVAAVADVLRNEERRKTYDLILKMGLPDWRAPIYYYRRVRNMGLSELAVFLFCLATFFQYMYNLAAYWEKRYNLEEALQSRKKKKPKHLRKANIAKLEEEEELFIQEFTLKYLQKPKCSDLFPVALLRSTFHIIHSSPSYFVCCKEYLVSRKEEVALVEEPAPRIRTRKPTSKPKLPDYVEIGSSADNSAVAVIKAEDIQVARKHWELDSLTDAQLMELKKALKKFPMGTLQRWEKVADHLGCPVADVVTLVKHFKAPQQSKTIAEQVCHPLWRQEEQLSLEIALQKYPKDTTDRWDKVAASVATKTKEECMARFKVLAQQVKKKRQS